MNKHDLVQISPTLLRPRIAELGKIKIGGKGEERTAKGNKDTKYRLPVKLDHFLVTKRDRDSKTENFIRDEAIHRHPDVGAQPKYLDIFLMWDEVEDNFQYFLGAYDGKRERCRGNGLIAFDREQGEIPCTCPLLKQHQGPYAGPNRPGGVQCKPHGRLSVVLAASQTYGGYHVFRTTSWETISSIAASLQQFRAEFGGLRGLPLRMVVYPATDTYEEGGKTKTSVSYKVAVVLRADYKQAYQIAAAAREWRSQFLLTSGETKQLASEHRQQMEEAQEREAQEIAAEFHPETSGAVETQSDYEIVSDDEDEESEQDKLLIERIRIAYELANKDVLYANRKIKEHEGRIPSLVEAFEQQRPEIWEKSGEILAQRQLEAELEEESESAEDAPAESSAPLGLFD